MGKASTKRKATAKQTPDKLDVESKERKRPLKDVMIDKVILRKFKFGVKKACGKLIWDRITEWIAHESHEELAERIEVGRSDVTKGITYGALSLENLVVILTELRREFADLPAMPSREERITAGYEEAITWLCMTILDRTDDATITRLELFCVAALLRDPEYLAADAAGNLNKTTWNRILTRVRERATKSLGMHERDADALPFRTQADFEKLRRKWAKPVSMCRHAIPFRWIGAV